MVLAGAWAFGWDALVAIGTLTLATVTLKAVRAASATATQTKRLADETKDLAEVTRASVEVAQAEFAAQLRPLIADAPRGRPGEQETARFPGQFGVNVEKDAFYAAYNADQHRLVLSVPVRNVGTGPAVIAGDPWASRDTRGIRQSGRCERHLLPAGEVTRLNFLLGAATPDELADFYYVGVEYHDAGGQQFTTTVFAVPRVGTTDYELGGLAIYNGNSGEPVIVAGEGIAPDQPLGP